MEEFLRIFWDLASPPSPLINYSVYSSPNESLYISDYITKNN